MSEVTIKQPEVIIFLDNITDITSMRAILETWRKDIGIEYSLDMRNLANRLLTELPDWQ